MNGKEIGMKLENAVLKLMIAVLTVVIFGTVVIPAVLAWVYTWLWLLAYPVCLVAFLFCVFAKFRK